jgi:hypothetical protein
MYKSTTKVNYSCIHLNISKLILREQIHIMVLLQDKGYEKVAYSLSADLYTFSTAFASLASK